jgi:Fe-S oxidoreductase
MLTQTLDVFDGYDHIVTPAPSCLAALAHEYAPLAEDDDELGGRLERLSASLVDVAAFLDGPGRPPDGTRFATEATQRVGVHRFCQCSNVLGRDDRLERLLAELTTATVVPIAEAEVCCGFGGSSSIAAPEVSATIAERKLANIDAARVDIVVADNPGCILHLRGAIAARGDGPPVLHLAEFLAAGSG